MATNNDLSNLSLLKLLKKDEPIVTVLPLSELSRLDTALSDSDAGLRVSYRVRDIKGQNNLLLDLEIDGEMGVYCQRCLEVYKAPVSIKRTLLVERNKDESPMSNDEKYERISADFTWCLDLKAVITDEIILGVPLAHPDGCLDDLMAKYIVDVPESSTANSIGR